MELTRRNSKAIDSFISHLNNPSSSSSSVSQPSMDMNRNKRKSMVSTQDATEFSQSSILSAMDKFVSAVNNMDDTIMVPSRLMDMTLDQPAQQPPAPPPSSTQQSLNSADLFGFYNMLNTVKNELIWGPADRSNSADNNKPSVLTRRMSTLSVHSYSDSDVESESSNDFDSGVDMDEQSIQVANAFRQHLTGLFQALHQLTDAANYLTTRYQDEVDRAS